MDSAVHKDYFKKQKDSFMRLFLGILFFLISVNLYAQNETDHNYEYALIEAARQKSVGNLSEAINLYKKCIVVNPESSIAAYELGSIYAALNKLDLAESYLRTAYSMDQDNYWYLLGFSEILKANEKYKEAEELLKDYLKFKNDTKLKYSLATVYEQGGKNKKALSVLDELEKENGVSELVILKKVDILKAENEIVKAENEIKKLIDLMPESGAYQIILAEFLVETGQKERAAQVFEKAYATDTTNIYAITSLSDYYTTNKNFKRGFYFLEKALYHPGVKLENKVKTVLFYIEKQETIENYKPELKSLINALIITYPDNLQVKTLAYDFYSRIREYQMAFNLILELVDQKKDNFLFWQQAVFTASLLNEFDKIIEISNEALKIFPNKRELHLFKGIAYYQKGEFETSYSILIENYVLGLDLGTQLQFLTFLGESAYKSDKKNQAFEYFEELLLLDPDNIGIMNNYSYYLSLENLNLDRAKELSFKTIKTEPDNPVYLDTYGWILFVMGDYEEAHIYLQKAVKNSNDADVLFHYAEVLFKLGNMVDARIYYIKAKDAGYDKEIIENKLALCY